MVKIIAILLHSNEVSEGSTTMALQIMEKGCYLEIHNFELSTLIYLPTHLTTESCFLFGLVQHFIMDKYTPANWCSSARVDLFVGSLS